MFRPLIAAIAATLIAAPAFAGINDHRTAEGLDPVERNAALDAAAMTHAQDMADNGFFAHEGSDGSSAMDRIQSRGCSGGAENIAQGDFTDDSVFDAWMGSPPHRENILMDGATAYGLANAGEYWVLTLADSC